MVSAGSGASEQKDLRNAHMHTCNDAAAALSARKQRMGATPERRMTSDLNLRGRRDRFSIRLRFPAVCALTCGAIVQAIRAIGLHLQPQRK